MSAAKRGEPGLRSQQNLPREAMCELTARERERTFFIQRRIGGLLVYANEPSPEGRILIGPSRCFPGHGQHNSATVKHLCERLPRGP